MERVLPKYVTVFPDRHGKLRYRFRRKGQESRYLRAPFGSSDFDAEYADCLDGLEDRRRAFAKPQHQLPPIVGEIVYFIGAIDGRSIKIGYSRNPLARINELQQANAEPLHFLAVVKGGRSLEKSYHERFVAYRQVGEWFERSAPIEAEISRLQRLPAANS